MRVLEVHKNKSLRLDNVLIKNIFDTSVEESENEDGMNFELLISQMENQIRVKGANQIGPLIQYSGYNIDEANNTADMQIAFMLQADKYINNVDSGFQMKSVINVKNCMYVRFEGKEEDLQIAYQKIQVEAYENEIKLKGDSYTVFVSSNDETEDIVADIFMERED